jgi:hypothetical protein
MPRATSKKPSAKSRPKKTASKRAQLEVVPRVETSGYAVGDLVSHPQFGNGTVRAVDANKLTIEFEGGRVKQIVDYYVKRRGS